MNVSIQLTQEQLASLQVSDKQVDYSSNPVLDKPELAAKELAHLGKLKQEHFVILTLDGANRLINKHTITVGTLTGSLVHPREVFKKAIEDLAANIIVAHNHPSGALEASEADRAVTERLQDAGKIIGIEVLDHLIITKDSYHSIV